VIQLTLEVLIHHPLLIVLDGCWIFGEQSRRNAILQR
jgi:hypothetical protein